MLARYKRVFCLEMLLRETVVNSAITNSFTVIKPQSLLAISVVRETRLIQAKCVLKYTVNYLKYPGNPHILSGLRSTDIKLENNCVLWTLVKNLPFLFCVKIKFP